MDKKKIVHQLDTPYSTAKWPELALHDQDAILELLCTLLAPIGEYRAQNVTRSKGKREKKRKRALAKDDKVPTPPSPPPPELMDHVEVGLVAVTRRLQGMGVAPKGTNSSQPAAVDGKTSTKRPYSAVFIARAAQPSILNGHLPQMIAVASKTRPDHDPVRLVGLSKACEARLSEALGIPRVSCIALDADAPNAAMLLTFVRAHVSAIPLAWLPEAQVGEFQTTKINHMATTIGARKQVIES
ncbi:ribonuclease P/MRP protein subunit POP3 [Microdochium nivale]|nr:ribonuclease P/MRP protein subunit POP3 [Microdochium nivale]